MWTYAGVRIFTQEFKGEDKQIIARLVPLNNGTVFHYFGWEDTIVRINAYIVGFDDLYTLQACKRTGSEYTLTTPSGWMEDKDFSLSSLNWEAVKDVACQTLRPDLPATSPVFKVDLELYYDE